MPFSSDEDFWRDITESWSQDYANRTVTGIAAREPNYRAFMVEAIIWSRLSKKPDGYVPVRGRETSPVDYCLLLTRSPPVFSGQDEEQGGALMYSWAASQDGRLESFDVDCKVWGNVGPVRWDNPADMFIAWIAEVSPEYVFCIPGEIGRTVHRFCFVDSIAPFAVRLDQLAEAMKRAIAARQSKKPYVNPTSGVVLKGWTPQRHKFSARNLLSEAVQHRASEAGITLLWQGIRAARIPGFGVVDNPVKPLVADFIIHVNGQRLMIEHKCNNGQAVVANNGRVSWSRVFPSVERLLYGNWHFLILQDKASSQLGFVCLARQGIRYDGRDAWAGDPFTFRYNRRSNMLEFHDFLKQHATDAISFVKNNSATEVLKLKPEKAKATGQEELHLKIAYGRKSQEIMDQATWISQCLHRQCYEAGDLVCFHVAPSACQDRYTYSNLVVVEHQWSALDKKHYAEYGRRPFLTLGAEELRDRDSMVFRIFFSEANQVMRSKEARGRYRSTFSIEEFDTRNPPKSPPFMVLASAELSRVERCEPMSEGTMPFIVMPSEFFETTRSAETLEFGRRDFGRRFQLDGWGAPFLAFSDIDMERHQIPFNQLHRVCQDMFRNRGGDYRIPNAQSTKQNRSFDPAAYVVKVAEVTQSLWDDQEWKAKPRVAPFTKAQWKDVESWEQLLLPREKMLERLSNMHGLKLLQADLLWAIKDARERWGTK